MPLKMLEKQTSGIIETTPDGDKYNRVIIKGSYHVVLKFVK